MAIKKLGPSVARTSGSPGAAKDATAQPAKAKDATATTLGAYLEKVGKTPEDLAKSTWSMQSAARELLKAKGIDSPTKSQLTETQYQINEAIQGGKWKSFTAQFEPGLLKLEDGVNQRLGNIFFERQAFSQSDLTLPRLKLSPNELKKLNGDYESGRSGMLLAASFISTSHRAEGDFTRAYGDKAWRGYMRAHNFLQSIPKGEFIGKLDIGLIQQANEKIHAPDTGMKAALLRAVAFVGRGGRWDKGGKLREGRQYARPEDYTAEQVEAFKEAGVKVVTLMRHSDGRVKAMLEYPKPDQVKPRLQEIVDELKSELAKDDADPIGAAATFQRHFVALHPFGDSNGRTSRLLMNRILAEFDLPPAVLKNQNHDVDRTPEQWRRDVAEGVARSKKFLSTRVEGRDNYIARMGIKVLDKSPDKPIAIDGNAFDLGRDGFLYDPTGRPWMAAGGEIVPLSQLEHYMISRRILMMGTEAGTAKLKELTAETRALYDQVSSDASTGEGIAVRPDQASRKADIEYSIAPQPEIAGLLVELADVDKIDPAQLFAIKRARGTDITSTISKHAQIDLELWYLERGLKFGGHKKYAKQIHAQRAKLFDKARAHLLESGNKAYVSEDNPLGFKFKYEQLMYEQSPLRYESLDQAIDKQGDGQITVWRGDYSFARLIGMAPNNDVRQPDARHIAEERAGKGQVTNIYDDLTKLEGSAIGRQYICTTSDLALLAGAFASKKKTQAVNLGVLPGFIADTILGWIDPEKGAEDLSPADKAKAKREAAAKLRETNAERGEAGLDPLPPKGTTEIKDKFGVPGTLFTLRVKERSSKKIEVGAARKAFMLRLDKDALLPGIVALGGPSFENEQEMHGLERVYPWHIKAAYEAKSLKEEFPVTHPDAAAMKAMAPGGGGKGAVYNDVKGEYVSKGDDKGFGIYDKEWSVTADDAKGSFDSAKYGEIDDPDAFADDDFVVDKGAAFDKAGFDKATFDKGEDLSVDKGLDDPASDPLVPDENGAYG